MTNARRFDPPLPGDVTKDEQLERFVRVDHAGEYGAVRIYQGQMAVLGRSRHAPQLKHMLEQERQHLDYFARQITQRGGRPTALLPLWHVAGFALGAATALLGEKAAMACTIAVEETIDGHYQSQRDALGGEEPELKEKIEQFRVEELEHRDVADAAGGREAPGWPVLSTAIRAGSKAAIWLSERI